jgi:predicted alpha/beta hydrolase family esterase
MLGTIDVLFVQGAGPDVHAKWDLALVENLRRELGPRYVVHYPQMPNEADPRFADWKPALEKEFAALRNGAIVVGHSAGGAILLNVLTESAPSELAAIMLIAAPFIGDGGWESEDVPPQPALGERLPAGVPVFLYHGESDDIVPVAHVELYARAIPAAHVRRLAGRDHQFNNDLSEVANDIRDLESR